MSRRAIGILAAVLAALVVAGCGSTNEDIPTGEADALQAQLVALQAQVDSSDCEGADQTVTTLFDTASELPKGEAKDGVRDLLKNLRDLVERECPTVEEPTTTTTSTTSSSTSEPTTETTTTTEPTTSTTTTTEPTTTTTTDEAPAGDDGSGGASPGRGNG